MAPELYEEFGHCMAGLMKLGVTKEVPWEVPADKVEGDTLQIVKGVPSTLAPCREAEDALDVDGVVVDVPAAPAMDAVPPVVETKMVKSGRVVLSEVRVDEDPDELSPTLTTLFETCTDAAHLLIYMPDSLIQFATDWRSIAGLAHLLDRQAYTALQNDLRREPAQSLLVPILSTLVQVCRANNDARYYMKKHIFGDLCDATPPYFIGVQTEAEKNNAKVLAAGPKVEVEAGTFLQMCCVVRCVCAVRLLIYRSHPRCHPRDAARRAADDRDVMAQRTETDFKRIYLHDVPGRHQRIPPVMRLRSRRGAAGR
jgi:hypothetical protein